MRSIEIIQNADELYEKYPIPQNLRRHMLLVAGVAKQVCDNYCGKINSENIIAAAIIHDLGNIIKMKLTDMRWIGLLDQIDQNNLNYFIIKQKEFIEKYGANEEEANRKIAQELKVSKGVLKLIDNGAITIKDGKAKIVSDVERQIMFYSDLRVAPKGVVFIKERLEEFAERYEINKDKEKRAHSKIFTKAALKMEKELFSKVKIKPGEITQKSTEEIVAKHFLSNNNFEKTIRAYYAHLDLRDIDKMMQIFAPNLIFNRAGQTIRGINKLHLFYEKGLKTTGKHTIKKLIVKEKEVIVKGKFLGVDTSNAQVKINFNDSFTFNKYGKVEKRKTKFV